MGEELASVDDHPKSQVLSFSGTSEGLGSAEVNVPHSAEARADNEGGEVSTKEETDPEFMIGSEEPPVPMERVRENNRELEESSQEKRGMFTNETIGWTVLGLLVLTGVAGAIGVFARKNNAAMTKESEVNNG